MSMTSQEVMQVLGISAANLYQYRKRNKVKYYVDEKGKYSYDEDSVYALIQNTGRGKKIVAYDRIPTKGVSEAYITRMEAVRIIEFHQFKRKKNLPDIEVVLENYETPNTTIFSPKFEKIFTEDVIKEMKVGTIIFMYKDSLTSNEEDRKVLENLLIQKGVRILYVHDFYLGDRVTDLDAECILNKAPWHLIEHGIFNYEKKDSRYYIPRKEIDEFLAKENKDIFSIVYLRTGIKSRLIKYGFYTSNYDVLDDQLKTVKNFCKKYSLPIDSIYLEPGRDDFLSSRKVFEKLLKDIKEGTVRSVYALKRECISYDESEVEYFLSLAKQTKTLVYFVEEELQKATSTDYAFMLRQSSSKKI